MICLMFISSSNTTRFAFFPLSIDPTSLSRPTSLAGIYMYEEKRGTIAIAKPGEKLDVISSFQIPFGDKEHWAHPVICDGILYVRHGNVLGAYDIKAK